MTHTRRHRQVVSRRGVAMLLIVIALVTGTLLATAYLASRDNSGAIGANVAEASAARWASESGMEYAVVILQTEKDWRTRHVNGTLFADHPVGAALVTLDLLDLETGLPPTETTRHVQLTSTAVSSGVTRVTRAVATVPVGEETTVDLDLGEFGAFVTREMKIADQASVARWGAALLSDKRPRVPVGTTATSAGSVSVSGQATPIDTTVFAGPAASGSLLSVSNGSKVQDLRLTDNVVVPAPPGPGVLAPTLPLYPTLTVPAGGKTVLSSSQRYDSITVQSSGELVLQGNIAVVSEKDLTLGDQARIVVDSGKPRLVVWGDVNINKGGIVMKGDATVLALFVGDDVTITSGYFGDAGGWNESVKRGQAGYMNPSRLIMFSIDSLLSDGRVWQLTGDTLFKGRLYAPSAAVTLSDNAALYGNAVVNGLTLNGASGLFHDPSMNTGRGYTNPRSKVYGPDQKVKFTFKTLASMDDVSMLAASTLEGVVVKGLTGLLGSVDAQTDDPTVPGVPTERPIPVDVTIESAGLTLGAWEGRGTDWKQTPQRVEADSRALAARIGAFDTAQFTGSNVLQRTTRRNDLAARATNAADAIVAGNYALAESELLYIFERTGGNLGVTQFMVTGAAQQSVRSESGRLQRAADGL